jgi:hypothetical protein
MNGYRIMPSEWPGMRHSVTNGCMRRNGWFGAEEDDVEEEEIFALYESEEFTYMDAIEELQKIGYDPKEAEKMIDNLGC